MTFIDALHQQPRARAEYGPDGGTFEDIQSATPLETGDDWAHVFKQFGLDPAKYEVVGDTVRCSTWQQSARAADGTRDVVQLYSYKAAFTRRMETLDLPALAASALRKARTVQHATRKPGALVVALADVQIGKTDLRGATPQLLERVEATLARLDAHLTVTAPERIILADVGDLIEGFESGGDPHRTNDLSHPEQIDLAATVVHRFVRVCAEHAPTTVVAVPSNHGAWRRGKQKLGFPSDDYGIAVHKIVQNLTGEAEWVFPAPFDEHVTVDVDGTLLGFVHGHQYAPGGMFKWLAGQALGGTSIGNAEVVVSGHYHHLTIDTDGRAPNGRGRWWLQAPTLDNGSAWYRTHSGSDTDPGLLVFAVDSQGIDLSGLTIL